MQTHKSKTNIGIDRIISIYTLLSENNILLEEIPISEIKKPIIREKKIERIDIDIVIYSPFIKKNKFEAPESTLGSNIYQAQL